MDEEQVESGAPTVGDQLRAARKKKKLSLEDIASQTRIPLRHLESLEEGDWANLPAPTYTVGFAKSYASIVDLDRTEIGEQLRAEMGGGRMEPMVPSEVFEPADPARTMPKWLVIGAIIAVLLIVLVMTWLNNRSLEGNDEPVANEAAAPAAATPAPAQQPVPQGPVVLSANEPLWMSVYEKGGTSYFAGILKPGTNFMVPPTAVAPMLGTAKPESLKIMVGQSLAPPVGAPGAQVKDVSLLPADLMKPKPAISAPAVAGPPPSSSPPPVPAPRRATSRRPAPQPQSQPAAPAPATNAAAPTNTTG